eukprot:GHVU01100803.1.p1 GENE.GHVU01100803.1~~GHVU01100803.1.p1  ORF type:complete len:581 (+),score=22.61 GHVU01100803.1:81-1823(+)
MMQTMDDQEEGESTRLLPGDRRNEIMRPQPADISPIIHETDTAITIRRPVHYNTVSSSPEDVAALDNHASATINRYRYYNKLAPHRNSVMLMPNHIVPPQFFYVIPIEFEVGKQSSIITIFSIWNTMMGTSLLSMPWAIQQAGFACGLALMVTMAGITLYTAHKVMQSVNFLASSVGQMIEFSDVCSYYLGRCGKIAAVVFSLVTLMGAAIVYWVLMTNFLYHTVQFIYEQHYQEPNSTSTLPVGNFTTSYVDAFCPETIWETLDPATPVSNTTTEHPPVIFNWTASAFSGSVGSNSTEGSIFNKVWSQTHTVPFFLVAFLAPLINFKSPTFFTKFNALGTVSVLYILSFVTYKAVKWNFHMEFVNPADPSYIPLFSTNFPALTGTLSLALFIHNCIISIMRNQRHPENNTRDLSIAYICVTLTYVIVGVLFYTSFPLQKACIEDNFLNNFRSSDVAAFTARIFLFFQMITVFPLLMYLFRIQFMHVVFNNIYPGFLHVIGLNTVLVSICIVFAIFLPKIGTILRFSGAFCGLAYIFALPCLVYMLIWHEKKELTWTKCAFHSTLIVIGAANFVGQFLVT